MSDKAPALRNASVCKQVCINMSESVPKGEEWRRVQNIRSDVSEVHAAERWTCFICAGRYERVRADTCLLAELVVSSR